MISDHYLGTKQEGKLYKTPWQKRKKEKRLLQKELLQKGTYWAFF